MSTSEKVEKMLEVALEYYNQDKSEPVDQYDQFFKSYAIGVLIGLADENLVDGMTAYFKSKVNN